MVARNGRRWGPKVVCQRGAQYHQIAATQPATPEGTNRGQNASSCPLSRFVRTLRIVILRSCMMKILGGAVGCFAFLFYVLVFSFRLTALRCRLPLTDTNL